MGKRRASPFEAPPYNREGNRKARRKAEQQRVTTMGMLLGARWIGDTWSKGYYVRSETERDGGVFNSYWDRTGKRISSIEASKIDLEAGPKWLPTTPKPSEKQAAYRLAARYPYLGM